MTLTKTLAWRRSPLTSTCVMLANPTRGSFTRVRNKSLSSTAINSPSFSCRCGFGMNISFVFKAPASDAPTIRRKGPRPSCIVGAGLAPALVLRAPALAPLHWLHTRLDAFLCVGLDNVALVELSEIIKHYATLIASGDL